jgi:hypothetical protein
MQLPMTLALRRAICCSLSSSSPASSASSSSSNNVDNFSSPHRVAITAIHTSHYNHKRVWTGDASGRVYEWRVPGHDTGSTGGGGVGKTVGGAVSKLPGGGGDSGGGGSNSGHVWWHNDSHCYRPQCRRKINTLLERRHHCRGCAQQVCQRCSKQKLVLPQFGYLDAVRVCDECYKTRSGSGSVVR